MSALQSNHEMKKMMLTELVGLCKKLGKSSAIDEKQRAKVHQFVNEFDLLMSTGDDGIPSVLFEGQLLTIQIARFLPAIVNDYYDPDAYLDHAS